MKKIQLLILATAGFVSAAQAQVSVIPKIGLNIANVFFDDDREWNNQRAMMGLTAGVGINCPIGGSELISIQPELLYSQKGFAAKGKGALDYRGRYTLNYLEIPVLFKASFALDPLQVYVNAGPSIGFLTSGRVRGKWDVYGWGDDVNEKIEFTNDPDGEWGKLHANRTEIGLNIGAGIGYELNKRATVIFDLRYNAGLTDFDQEQTSKNGVLALTAGLQIPLN